MVCVPAADVPRLQLHVQHGTAAAMESLRCSAVHRAELRQQRHQPGRLRLHERLLQELVHEHHRLSAAAVAASQRHCVATEVQGIGTTTTGTVSTVRAQDDHTVWPAGPFRQDQDHDQDEDLSGPSSRLQKMSALPYCLLLGCRVVLYFFVKTERSATRPRPRLVRSSEDRDRIAASLWLRSTVWSAGPAAACQRCRRHDGRPSSGHLARRRAGWNRAAGTGGRDDRLSAGDDHQRRATRVDGLHRPLSRA